MNIKYIFPLFLVCFSFNVFSQMTVVDPVVVSTLVVTHAEQQVVLNDIEDSEGEIRDYQTLIAFKMEQIKGMQKKTYEYLSKVNSVVKNGKDIIYASTLVKDIAKYQKLSAKYAAGDPKLLIICAKTEYELISRSLDLTLYIYDLALKGGDKNMMDNKQRIDLCIHVVAELKRMRGIAYSVSRQMRFAQQTGVFKTLAIEQFKYVNKGATTVKRILDDLDYISKGGN